MCIYENDDDVIKKKDVRDRLKHMYRAYDQRYNYRRTLSHTSSTGATSSGADPLQWMWDQKEETGSGTNDLERYTTDRVFLCSEEKANLEVIGWWKTNSSSFPILCVLAKDLVTTSISLIAAESTFSNSSRVISKNKSRLALDIVEATICLVD